MREESKNCWRLRKNIRNEKEIPLIGEHDMKYMKFSGEGEVFIQQMKL